MTQAEIAKLVDKSRSHVANFQRLLALPDDVLCAGRGGQLKFDGHARGPIGNDDASDLRAARSEKLSVRETWKSLPGIPQTGSRKKASKGVAGGSGDADIEEMFGAISRKIFGMVDCIEDTPNTAPSTFAIARWTNWT